MIAQIEAVGPLLALSTWPDLRDKLWIHFIDNTVATDSMIKGDSVNAHMNELMHATWRQVKERNLHLRVEYVCTHDNPIDKASRGNVADLFGERWIFVTPGNWASFL